MQYLIADVLMKINYTKEEYLAEELQEFKCESDDTPDVIVDIKGYDEVSVKEDIKVRIDSERLKVKEDENCFYIFYREDIPVRCIQINKDGKNAIIYMKDVEYVKTPLFCAIRDIFFYNAQKKGMIAVHSSTIIYRERAYVFSACSGTGKTTHTNIWIEEEGVSILDGDICVLRVQDDKVYAYGLPWAGSSKKFLNRKVRLGGIVFLARGIEDVVHRIDLFDSSLRLTARCFTPTYTPEMSEMNMDASVEVCKRTSAYVLCCTKEKSAYKAIKKVLDEDFREE